MNAARTLRSSGGLASLRGSTRMVLRGVPNKKFAPAGAARFYTPMTVSEEENEKARVAGLSPVQKASELKGMDKELALLNMKRGINTGEQYTLRGKFKAMTRDYGIPFMAWYWTVWFSTATLVYGCIELGNVDAVALIAEVDGYTGWSVSKHVDPTFGTIGLTLAVNELLEPLRLPIVVLTTKPVVDALFPKNY